MSIHRKDLPDAPVRVKQSVLNPGSWLWTCWDKGTTSSGHRGHGYPSWEDAFAAMEKHRREKHYAWDPDKCACRWGEQPCWLCLPVLSARFAAKTKGADRG